MQGNPPQDLIQSPEIATDEGNFRSDQSLHLDKGLKTSRESSASSLSPRKVTDHTSRDFLSPRRLNSLQVQRKPSKERGLQDAHCSSSFKVDGEVDVTQLNTLLQFSLSKLTSMESEKHDRYERWKQEAVEHGMKMVELERKRSDEEHAILLKRIAFLSEELEETKKLLRAKTQECEEIADIAEQLSTHFEASMTASSPPSSAASSTFRSPLAGPFPFPFGSPTRSTPASRPAGASPVSSAASGGPDSASVGGDALAEGLAALMRGTWLGAARRL